MAVLIERIWSTPGDPSNASVTTAILPSGKILTLDVEDSVGSSRADMQKTISIAKKLGKNESQIFEEVALMYSSSLGGDFVIVEDPQEARRIINEARLTATVTSTEREEYKRSYDPSIGDGMQMSYAEASLVESLEQSNGNRKEKA